MVAMKKLLSLINLKLTVINKVSAQDDLKRDLHVPPPLPKTLCINQCIKSKLNINKASDHGLTLTTPA